LATLLAISYRSAQKIPLGFSEFYDELFQILLIRHDASKLGWRRHRKSKLDDRQIQHIFEAFCFSTRKKQFTSIDQEVAYQIAVDSIGEVGFDAEPQPFLDDIRKITCLLIEEGKKMAFVHASVQEFFAARYIKTRTDIVAQRFYAQVLNGKWSLWPEELNFLRQIDSHRAMKYFYIPDAERTVLYILDGQPDVTSEVAIGYLQLLKVVKKPRTTTSAEKYVVEKMRSNNFKHLASIDTQVFSKMFTWSPETPEWMVSFQKNPSSTERTYYEIAVDRGEKFETGMIQYIVTIIENLQKDFIRMRGLVAKHEEESEFMDLS
jgi:predicted NACHT family NTPase